MLSRSKDSLREQPKVERLVARRFFSSRTKAAWFSFQPAWRRRVREGRESLRGLVSGMI